MSTITKERVAEFIKNPLDNGLTRGEQMELARIALASLEAEPVAYADPQAFRNFKAGAARREWMWRNPGENLIPLFTSPPEPVSDSLLLELLDIAKRAADEADECAHAEFSDDSMEHSAAIADWERRAAMLQGAEPVTSAYKLPEPIKDHRLNSGPDADDYYSGYQEGWNEALEAVSGNSPVIPDGWVACSERMPEDKQYEIWLFDGENVHYGYTFDGGKFNDWRGEDWEPLEGVTHWMKMALPAAPQQEVK